MKSRSIVAALLVLAVSVIGVVFLLGRSSAVNDSTLALNAPSMQVQNGDSIPVAINLSGTDQFLAISADVTYDTSQLSFEGLDANLIVSQAEESSGTIELILGDSSPLTGQVGTLNFSAIGSTGATTIALSNIEGSDAAGNTFTLSNEDVTLNYDSGTGGTGNGFFILAEQIR